MDSCVYSSISGECIPTTANVSVITSPTATPNPVSISGDGSFLSGLTGLFSSVGGAITSTYNAINRPGVVIPGVAPGTYPYQTPTTTNVTAAGSFGNLFLFGLVGLIAILLLRRR